MPALRFADTRELTYGYAWLIDERRFDELHTIFTPDIRISGPGYVMQSLPDVVQGMEVLRQYDRTYHLVGNHLGRWETAEQFRGETYCMASHIYLRDGTEWNYVMAIRYQDIIVRQEGMLRFRERQLRVTFVQDLPLTMAS